MCADRPRIAEGLLPSLVRSFPQQNILRTPLESEAVLLEPSVAESGVSIY